MFKYNAWLGNIQTDQKGEPRSRYNPSIHHVSALTSWQSGHPSLLW